MPFALSLVSFFFALGLEVNEKDSVSKREYRRPAKDL